MTCGPMLSVRAAIKDFILFILKTKLGFNLDRDYIVQGANDWDFDLKV
jgi:hypothetical protein